MENQTNASAKDGPQPESAAPAQATSGSPLLDAIGELDIEIADLVARRRRTKRNFILALSLVGVFLALGVSGVAFTQSIAGTPGGQSRWLSLLAYSASSVVIISLFGVVISICYFVDDLDQLSAKLIPLAERKRILERMARPTVLGSTAAQPAGSNYVEGLVSINVENLAAYYQVVKSHAQKSFYVSLIVGMIGFLLIAAGLVLGYASPQGQLILTYIAAGAGVVTEFISAVFFYLYYRTVRQMKEYHDSLIIVQNTLLSFKIVGETEKGDQKLRMIEKLLLYLIGSAGPTPLLIHPRRAKGTDGVVETMSEQAEDVGQSE